MSAFPTVSYFWTPIVYPTSNAYCLRFKYSIVSNINQSMGNLSAHKYFLKDPRFASEPLFQQNGVAEKVWVAAKVDVPVTSLENFVVSGSITTTLWD